MNSDLYKRRFRDIDTDRRLPPERVGVIFCQLKVFLDRADRTIGIGLTICRSDQIHTHDQIVVKRAWYVPSRHTLLRWLLKIAPSYRTVTLLKSCKCSWRIVVWVGFTECPLIQEQLKIESTQILNHLQRDEILLTLLDCPIIKIYSDKVLAGRQIGRTKRLGSQNRRSGYVEITSHLGFTQIQSQYTLAPDCCFTGVDIDPDRLNT